MEKLFTDLDLEAAGYGSRSTLRKNRTSGRGIPFVYIGAKVRYRESDIKAFLEANVATHALQRPNRKVTAKEMTAQP